MKEYLIKYLNEQLISEYEAIFNYLYYSVKVQNDEIRRLMVDFSRDEFEHARMLIRHIVNLGGEPAFMLPNIEQEKDVIPILIKSIAAEESAVKKYTMIQQIIDEPEYKKIIGETVKVEEEHRKKLENILSKIKEQHKKKNKPS